MSRDFTPGDLEDIREETPSPHPARQDGRRTDERRESALASRIDRSRESSPHSRPSDLRSQDVRTTFYDRDHAYPLRESQTRTLIELGRFRVVAAEDLATYAYPGQRDRMQEDIRNLLRHGLIRRGTFEGADASSRELLTLTKSARKLLRSNRIIPQDQSLYSGFVKPREANHDADIYRLYQKEAARIEAAGGKNLRVILDFELKKKLNRDLATFGAESREQIAVRHGLRVVNGKIPVPDLRIEYETREGNLGRVDLELATEHYRPRQLAEKVRAGFSIYASSGEADRLRRVLDQRGLTAEILTL